MSPMVRSVFITGGGGYLGSEVIRRLAREPDRYQLTSFDVRPIPAEQRLEGVEYLVGDVRDPKLLAELVRRHVDTVVHLASIVNPGGPAQRSFEHSVDVEGTENVLWASVVAGVRHLVITSSGAAYGYHADNPIPLKETDPLRGNPEFAYADHKRQVEELLARFRRDRPQLRQLVFRPGTVLGTRTDNQITRLLRGDRGGRPGRWVIGLRGHESPFVFVWDQDVAECIAQGIERKSEGIFNLAGDGTLSPRQIAALTGRRYLAIPPTLLRGALWLLQKLGRTPHGPEQVLFLQYRPVLANEKLKEEFGYRPRKTTEETFRFFWNHGGDSSP